MMLASAVPRFPKFDPITFLLDRRYPLFRRQHHGGLYEGDAVWELNPDRTKLERTLKKKSHQEIDELVRLEYEKIEAERPHNHADATADYDFWGKCATWSLEEATALSFGKNPEKVNWRVVSDYTWNSPFRIAYRKRSELIRRAQRAGQLTDPVGPGIFLTWAQRLNIELPDELIQQVINDGQSLLDWKSLYDASRAAHDKVMALLEKTNSDNEQLLTALKKISSENAELRQRLANSGLTTTEQTERPLNTRERYNLEAVGLLGAIKSYGYVPGKRNEASRLMEADLLKIGFKYSADSIREHLKAVDQDLAPGWEQRIKRNSVKG